MVVGYLFIGLFAAVVTPAIVVLMIPLSALEFLGCAFLGANVTVLGFIGVVLLRDFSAQLIRRKSPVPPPQGDVADEAGALVEQKI